MIHEVGVDLHTQLQKRKFPFPVIDGGSPEARPSTTFGRERIVIEHDPNGDTVGPKLNQRLNPKAYFTRQIGGKITIYAKSPAKGAPYWLHKRRAEKILDGVLVCLYVVAVGRQNIVSWKSGRFVVPDEFKGSDTLGGAVYELFFTFDRGVVDRNWDDTIGEQVTISPSMINAPNLTFAATGHTITRDVGSWLQDQFAVGQSILISGSTSNNGTFGPITALTDTVMTFASGLVNEGPRAGVTVTGTGVVIANSTNVSESGATTESA